MEFSREGGEQLGFAMHIIIGAIFTLAALFWAFTKLVDATSDAKAAARRLTWKHKHNKRLVDQIDDPREGAAILMVGMITNERNLTDDDRLAIVGQMKSHFDLSEDDSHDLYAFATTVMAQTSDVFNIFTKVLNPIQVHCDDPQRLELIDMLSAVADETGGPTERQGAFISRVRNRLGV